MQCLCLKLLLFDQDAVGIWGIWKYAHRNTSLLLPIYGDPVGRQFFRSFMVVYTTTIKLGTTAMQLRWVGWGLTFELLSATGGV